MKKLLFVLILITLLSSFTHATDYYDDGGTHIIDSYLIQHVIVSDSIDGNPTTVELISQGAIGEDISIFGNSSFTQSGGAIGRDVFSANSSSIYILGGTIGRDFLLRNDSSVIIEDGAINRWLVTENNSILLITGGARTRGIATFNYSQVTYSGGTVAEDINTKDESSFVLRGGFIDGILHPQHNSVITVVGTGFNYPLGYIADTSGAITGTLANGDPFDVPFVREGNGAILLKDPEISLAVIAPNGGGRYLTDKPVDIEYTTEGDAGIDSVDIEYSPDNGSSWITIATGISNTGTYEWVIPNIESEECLVKVSSADNPTITDISDGTFIIFQCSEVNPADLNSDCYVNLIDFALFAENWLWCGDRYNASCGVE